LRYKPHIAVHYLTTGLLIPFILSLIISCGNSHKKEHVISSEEIPDSIEEPENSVIPDNCAVLVLPANPQPGEIFRVLAVGGEDIRTVSIMLTGPSGNIESVKSKSGDGIPAWKIDDFAGQPAGEYKASMLVGKKCEREMEFRISPAGKPEKTDKIWETKKGWDPDSETLYSGWINALFQDCTEQSSWSALHEVTQDREHNFLFNYLSLAEDNPDSGTSVVMKPDCADNPFFLRAYFAWKLGLPFGYHLSDRGSLNRAPGTGKWITNETRIAGTNTVQSFNSFLRKIMDGVHSGTARTKLDNVNSDYYPIPLQSGSIRPGTVYADPYGHTLVIIDRVKQTKDKPGLLLAVDAQPDGTIGIRRFWKGNFLFNTSGVIGEPGFKAFRPIKFFDGGASLVSNGELTSTSGFIPFSLQQKNMEMELFYRTIEGIINPEPLDPDAQLSDLINALHEQLLVRVISVSNGEAYLQSHPGSIIEMPGSAAGIFLAGGLWESFSTPNRDLRLLIAMDALLGFPGSLLEKKASELEVSYTRTDGSVQKLTVWELLKRREAFEMAYNPNDGIEIRWGAPENSEERSTCLRSAPESQYRTMLSVRGWFQKRLHPPT
jgi:hypothetical protein